MTYTAPGAQKFRNKAGSLSAKINYELELISTNVGSRSATIVIAASNSSAKSKAQADYVCDGKADNVKIQAALDALPATGGEIHLLDGTYQLAATVARAIDAVAFSGCGNSTRVFYDTSSYVFSVGVQKHWTFSNMAVDFGGIGLETGTKWAISNIWRIDAEGTTELLIDSWSDDHIAPRSKSNFMSESHEHPLVAEIGNFEDSDWSGSALTYDTSIVRTHVQSGKVVTPVGSMASISRASALPDTTDCAYGIWIYTPDYTKINAIRLYRNTTGNAYNYCIRYPYAINDGWMFIVFDTIEEHVYNTPDPTTSSQLMIEIYPGSGESATVYVDSILYWKRSLTPNGAVTFTFDDGHTEVESDLLPIFSTYGYKGVQSLIISRLDDARIISAKKLQSAGWDVVNHTMDHESVTTMKENPGWEYLVSQKWLADNGFERGSAFAALGFGTHDKNLMEKVNDNIMIARTYGTNWARASSLPALSTLVNTHRIVYETSVAGAKSWIDAAVLYNQWINITFHDIVDTPTRGYDWSPAQVEELLAYCSSVGIEVLTYTDVVNRIRSTAQNMRLSGTGTITNGTTTVNIRHGFHKEPTSIQITPTSSLGSATSIWISSKDTGTGNLFSVDVNTDPGADVTFDWVAVL